jgi:uncharacterized repeat protein (TIGR04138 family)
MLLHPSHPIAKLLQEDKRYAPEAYLFVFEALGYAQNVLHMGTKSPSEPTDEPKQEKEDEPERHVSGQELCEAIRRFALDQFGYMAKTVLNNWGIRETGDVGEIVYNLIRIGQMRKTPQDRREDFDNVFDFDTAFQKEFKFAPPKQ